MNALGHFSPALALLLLAFFSRVDVARPSWLVLGVSGVLASNLLIGLGRGQRSLPPLAVWGWGVLVYLADFPAGLFLFLAGAVPALPFFLPGGLGWRPGRPGRDFLSRWMPGGLGLGLVLVLVLALLLLEQRGLLPVSG